MSKIRPKNSPNLLRILPNFSQHFPKIFTRFKKRIKISLILISVTDIDFKKIKISLISVRLINKVNVPIIAQLVLKEP